MSDQYESEPEPIKYLMGGLVDFLVACQEAARQGLPDPDPKDYPPR